MRTTWNQPIERRRCSHMPTSIRFVRSTTALAAVVSLFALPGCSPAQSPTSPPSTTPSSSVASTPDPSDLRGRLAAGLQGTSPVNARLVSEPKTTLEPVDTAWLTGWQVLDVQNQTPPHPRRIYAALSDSGDAVVLTGQPAEFSSMLQQVGVSVGSAAVAEDVAAVFLDATRTFATYSYRIDGVDDIKWRPQLTADQQSARDQVVSAYGKQIASATAEQSSSGWMVIVWTVSGTDLVRHQVTIGSDGTVADQTETVASDLPVPISR